jgi:hypothetical protein
LQSSGKDHHEGAKSTKVEKELTTLGVFRDSFEKRDAGKTVSANGCDYVIPAWNAGIQVDMDVSGRILRAWMPAVHAGRRKNP